MIRGRRGAPTLAGPTVAALALAALALAAVALVIAGCAGSGGKPTLRVSAAASLRIPFTTYGREFGSARASFSFAGSDELAAQIRQGVKPDVFASANTKLPDLLHAQGLVESPVVFAANRLVVAVPAGSTRVRSIADLAKRGVTIGAGSPSVPVGSYTRQVLGRLAPSERAAILANVRSNEPDVAGVVGKLTQGAIDAGFVYVTDVRGAGGKLAAIELPSSLQPQVAYAVAVVSGTAHRREASAFIEGLLAGAGRRALRGAGFQPPPRP
ncbi:MAG TPA: molybdate ABC transporter substrate-binding protein [Solirubrobacteraceae bacterium]|nr:molybdate ABC transporter substrate-binding protein [Solirubrobacteraceae bacterium]